MHRYRIVISFSMPSLSIDLFAWIIRMYSDKDAPDGMHVRIERQD